MQVLTSPVFETLYQHCVPPHNRLVDPYPFVLAGVFVPPCNFLQDPIPQCLHPLCTHHLRIPCSVDHVDVSPFVCGVQANQDEALVEEHELSWEIVDEVVRSEPRNKMLPQGKVFFFQARMISLSPAGLEIKMIAHLLSEQQYGDSHHALHGPSCAPERYTTFRRSHEYHPEDCNHSVLST